MQKRFALAVFISIICNACASMPPGFAGHYDPARHVYANPDVGFHLTLPAHWLAYTQTFSVPQALRADQAEVLEAYDPGSNLGLVIVVQQGPVLEIDRLVQRMQAVPESRLAAYLAGPYVTDFQQLSLQKILVNTQATVEWIYTARDTTGSQALEVTVSYYIFKVAERYVHLAFSTPSAAYDANRDTIAQVVNTFQVVTS